VFLTARVPEATYPNAPMYEFYAAIAIAFSAGFSILTLK
jgi:hypothetical protein